MKEISKENSASEFYDVKKLLVELIKGNKALQDSITSMKEEYHKAVKDSLALMK
jgi:hypothetical protein